MKEPKSLPASNRLGNHTASAFVEAYNQAESNEERGEIRDKLKKIDSGRWYDTLNEVYNHFARADLDGREQLVGFHSEALLRWIGVFGLVENLNTFEDVTGVERER